MIIRDEHFLLIWVFFIIKYLIFAIIFDDIIIIVAVYSWVQIIIGELNFLILHVEELKSIELFFSCNFLLIQVPTLSSFRD